MLWGKESESCSGGRSPSHIVGEGVRVMLWGKESESCRGRRSLSHVVGEGV